MLLGESVEYCQLRNPPVDTLSSFTFGLFRLTNAQDMLCQQQKFTILDEQIGCRCFGNDLV